MPNTCHGMWIINEGILTKWAGLYLLHGTSSLWMKFTTNTGQYIWFPKLAANSEPTDYETRMLTCTIMFCAQVGALISVIPYGK